MTTKPRIAVFSGPTATIQNSPPLVTGNKGRAAAGLPLLTDPLGAPKRFDAVRAQRLAAPVTVYVEYLSAHPLEADAEDLYAPPDGYLTADGTFTVEPFHPDARPVHRVTLDPADGLYLLPYVARQRDGSAWDETGTRPLAAPDEVRQTFYPDAARIYEEIDRFGLDGAGHASLLSDLADFDFYRPAPSGGWRKGRAQALRTDTGSEDIAPEVWGEDFFMYFPYHLRTEPSLGRLAIATNVVAKALGTGAYVGAQWLEGSPTSEESMYWLNLVIDTMIPLVGHSAQRPHQLLSADGDRNIYDGVRYITSGIWRNGGEVDAVGGVMIVDEQVFHSREVTKTDARPGNYQATGGHGGIVAQMGGAYGAPGLTYVPTKRHTWSSEVNLTKIPTMVAGVRSVGVGAGATVEVVPVVVKDDDGYLRPDAMPKVTITKYARYLEDSATAGADGDVEVMARIAENLHSHPLAGFVGEGANPYGSMSPGTHAALRIAVYSGMPVVNCGRGNTAGIASKRDAVMIAGDNLTSTKARLLLMACLLRFGAPPPAVDPRYPTADEIAATAAHIAQYQIVFETH